MQAGFGQDVCAVVHVWLGASAVGQGEACHHHITIELLEVEELPPVWTHEDTRRMMSERFKLEGNAVFASGDYSR